MDLTMAWYFAYTTIICTVLSPASVLRLECITSPSSRVPGEFVIGLRIWRSDVVHEGHLGILGFYGLVPGFDQYPLAGSIASWLH